LDQAVLKLEDQIKGSKSCCTYEKHCYLGFIYLALERVGKA